MNIHSIFCNDADQSATLWELSPCASGTKIGDLTTYPRLKDSWYKGLFHSTCSNKPRISKLYLLGNEDRVSFSYNISPRRNQALKFEGVFPKLSSENKFRGVIHVQHKAAASGHPTETSLRLIWQRTEPGLQQTDEYWLAFGSSEGVSSSLVRKPNLFYLWPCNIRFDIVNDRHRFPGAGIWPGSEPVLTPPSVQDIASHLRHETKLSIAKRLEPLSEIYASAKPRQHFDELECRLVYLSVAPPSAKIKRPSRPKCNVVVGSFARRFVDQHQQQLSDIAKSQCLSLLRSSSWWRQMALRYGINFVIAILVHFMCAWISRNNTARQTLLEVSVKKGEEAQDMRSRSVFLNDTIANDGRTLELSREYLDRAEVIRELFIHANEQLCRSGHCGKRLIYDGKDHPTYGTGEKIFEHVPLEDIKKTAVITVLRSLTRLNGWKLELFHIGLHAAEKVSRTNAYWQRFDLDAVTAFGDERRLLLMVLDSKQESINEKGRNTLEPFFDPYPLYLVNEDPGYRLLSPIYQKELEWRYEDVVGRADSTADRLTSQKSEWDWTQALSAEYLSTLPQNWQELEDLKLDEGSMLSRYCKWTALFLNFVGERWGSAPADEMIEEHGTAKATGSNYAAVSKSRGDLVCNHGDADVEPSRTATVLSADLADVTISIINSRGLNLTMPTSELVNKLESKTLSAELLGELFSNPVYVWHRALASSSTATVLLKPKPDVKVESSLEKALLTGVRVTLATLTRYLLKARDLDELMDKKVVAQRLESKDLPRDLVDRLIGNPELEEHWRGGQDSRKRKRGSTADENGDDERNPTVIKIETDEDS